jgi:hypothetical protein
MLVVLHAGVCDGQFLLWGETPAEAEVLIAGPPGRNRRSRAASGRGRVPPRSLYDAGAKTLSAALTAAGFERLADTRPTQGVVAWLPTVDHTPAAFSPLIAEPPASRAKLTCRRARTSSVLPENHANFCARIARMGRGAYLRTAASCLRTSCST